MQSCAMISTVNGHLQTVTGAEKKVNSISESHFHLKEKKLSPLLAA